MYDLVVKGGTVIDPAQGIHAPKDIAVSGGKIERLADGIAPTEAKKVVDAKGKIVTPGLIDLHAHVAHKIIGIGVPADRAGVLCGVTTVCDAGSTGYANFDTFRKSIISKASTDVFPLLHMSASGLAVIPNDLCGWHQVDLKAMRKTIEANRDIIRGVKIRAVCSVMLNLGIEAVKKAKELASEYGLFLMVHFGIGILPEEVAHKDRAAAFTQEILPLLEKNDILSHAYTWQPGYVIEPDGKLVRGFKEAIQRGVVVDIAQAQRHLSFEIAKKALERGILPTTLSTDLANLNMDYVVGLPMTMSRFLALGLSLDQVVTMTTINPARILGEEKRRGSLGKGMLADVSIFEPVQGDFVFSDGMHDNRVKGNLILVPRLTIKSGKEIETMPFNPREVY